MLIKILREIEKSKGSVSLQELSRRLNIDPGVLDGMLEHWVRKGRLQKAVAGYAANCEDTAACTACKLCPPARTSKR